MNTPYHVLSSGHGKLYIKSIDGTVLASVGFHRSEEIYMAAAILNEVQKMIEASKKQELPNAEKN